MLERTRSQAAGAIGRTQWHLEPPSVRFRQAAVQLSRRLPAVADTTVNTHLQQALGVLMWVHCADDAEHAQQLAPQRRGLLGLKGGGEDREQLGVFQKRGDHVPAQWSERV